MKALSIKNPWGFCIAKGWKDVENRTWKTNFRGRVLIHISKKPDTIFDWDEFQARYNLTRNQVWNVILERNKEATGCIIGEVDIVDCVQNYDSVWSVEDQYQWVLENPIIYDKYILNVKGKLGIWNFNQPITS